MTASSMRLRHRPLSTTPAEAAEKVLDIEPEDARSEEKPATAVRCYYGTGWGLARRGFSASRRTWSASRGSMMLLVRPASMSRTACVSKSRIVCTAAITASTSGLIGEISGRQH